MRILLIDDSRTMRKIQRAVLERAGFTDIGEACNGREALRKAKEFRPDLILVDWNMPKMNGLQFVKKYRRQDKTTPLIMVTTESERSRVIKAIKCGVNNYIVKPFMPDTLSQRIRDTLERVNQRAA